MNLQQAQKFTHLRCFVTLGLLALAQGILAQLPAAESLLSNGLNSFEVYGSTAPHALVEEVAVTGQPFTKALRINTFKQAVDKGNFGLKADINTNLHKGDVLWISFKARCLESTRETGEASFEFRFDQLVNGKYQWPSYLERGVSFGKEWTETSLPFVLTKDVKPADVRLIFKFDTYAQRFELGPVTFLNYGPGVKLSDLPRSFVRYEGSEPDAPWRSAAAERIEKYRKGDLSIKVIDASGKPVPGAQVAVRMKRIAFNWGTATNTQRLLDTLRPESRIYRDTLLKYFNQVVLENEMKWSAWTDPHNPHEQTLKGIQWLKAHQIPVRGHVMVWPSFQHSPKIVAELKNDTAALRALVFRHIEEQLSKMKGQFTEWDVVNEPYAHHDWLDLLGKEEMVKWFKAARAGAPGVKLFLNDYTMFHGEGPNAASEAFYNNVKFLQENGAPIDAIGEQGHIGGTPPAIPKVIERLNRFAELGLPIQISEFDINSNDDDLKARYLSDFMTAVFSHPTTVGFLQWGFWEAQHWFPAAALWNRDWTLRKHGKAFTDLVSKTWWTNFDGKTAPDGVSKLRGFCGDYTITVTYKGKTSQQQYTLGNQGGVLVVKL